MLPVSTWAKRANNLNVYPDSLRNLGKVIEGDFRVSLKILHPAREKEQASCVPLHMPAETLPARKSSRKLCGLPVRLQRASKETPPSPHPHTPLNNWTQPRLR